MTRNIHGIAVRGLEIDAETRCAHYSSERDIIAIKFHCCAEWYPCHLCHAAVATHAASVWPEAEVDARAVLCGACGHQLTVREYFECGSVCPRCARQFNPGCANHRHLYFASGAE